MASIAPTEGGISMSGNHVWSWQTCALITLYLALTLLFLLTFPGFFSSPVYPLDDAYIYMSMARNIAEHGIWGVTRYAFSGTSSAHLWVIILSICNKIFGANIWLPILLNLMFGTASIIAIALVANTQKFTGRQYFITGLAYLLLVFPSQLSTIGMEQALVAFLAIAFIWRVLKLVSEPRSNPKSLLLVFIVTALFCGVRYEPVYVVGPVILMFLAARRFTDAAVIMLGALTPIVGYGAFSIAHGGLFFPNTILLKGRVAFTDSMSAILYHQLQIGKSALTYTWLPAFLCLYLGLELLRKSFLRIPAAIVAAGFVGSLLLGSMLTGDPNSQVLAYTARTLSVFCVGAAVISLCSLVARARKELTPDLLIEITALAMTAHLMTAQFGWLFRYETYLLCTATMALACVITKYWPQIAAIEWKRLKLTPGRMAIIASAMILLAGLGLRLCLCISITPLCAAGVKEQHLEYAKFVQQNYPESVVALNDIGTTCFLAKDVHILDLWGLDAVEVAIARCTRKFDRAYMERIAKEKGADIAVLQDYWWKSANMMSGSGFLVKEPGVPPSWIKVGEWQTPLFHGAVNQVSFYAIKPELKDKLRENLQKYPLPSVDRLLPESEWN